MKVEPATGHAEAVTAIIRKHRILGAAAESELQALIRRSQVVTLAERESLFAEGDQGRTIVVVLSGHVKLGANSSNGREIVLEVCGPGSMFGELAVLNDWPRAAGATALSPCQVLAISGEAFKALLVRSPETMFAMMRVLSRRVRESSDRLRDGADLPGPVRLAKAVYQLAVKYAQPVPTGLRLDVQLSQRELGAMTGLSRETINKQLSTWRTCGWIEHVDGQITITDAEALRTLAEEGEASAVDQRAR